MTDSPKTPAKGGSKSLMENLLGLLRIRVKRGVNLAVRDVRSSDPYVVIKMGKQKLKTRVIKKDVNPEWNEDLTLSVTDPSIPIKLKLKTRVIKKDVNPEWNEDLTLSVTDPSIPIKLTVYDHDTFSKDDKMGDAEFGIVPYIEALKMNLEGVANGTTVTRIQPSRENCLAEESCIHWKDGKVVQDMCLRLRNVECGEVEIQLQWIDLPGSKGLS